MVIKHRLDNDILYVMLCGELDECSSNYTRTTLDKLCSNRNFKQLVIDFSELDFMDSTGIGVLIGRYKKLKDIGVPIYIYNPNRTVEKIFKMSGLYEIMPKLV